MSGVSTGTATDDARPCRDLDNLHYAPAEILLLERLPLE